MSGSLPTKLAIGFLTALLVLGVIVVLSYQSTQRFITTTREATLARNQRLTLEQALSAVRDLETGKRGYLITGEVRHLRPYASGVQHMAELRSRLEAMAGAPGIDREALATAVRLLDRKLEELATTIQVYQSKGFDSAAVVVRADIGRQTMDSLRQVVARLEAGQTAELARIDAVEARAATRTLLAVMLLAGIALGLFATVGLLLWRRVEAGRQRELALEDQRAALDEQVQEQTREVRRLNADLTRRVAEVETLFSVVPIGLGFATDPECREIRLNPTFGRMLRLTPDDNASKTGPEADRLPFRVVAYDGTEIPPENLVMQRTARTGRPVHNEAYQVVYADGQALDLLGSAAPLFDEQGRVRGVVGAFVDVSERRRADEQIQHAQRLQAVGQLAGGVAHEINNLMTTVLGFAEFALAGVGPDHPTAADLEQVLTAGHRAATVAQQLLAFSRRQVVQPRVLRLDRALGELRPTIERLAGANVRVRLAPSADGTSVRMDLGQLSQVLINLAANARDAMPEGGELVIASDTAVVEPPSTDGPGGLELAPGRYAIVTVRDTGIGMEPDTRRRAFEPFFTTKGVGSGTGLGLSIVYGIVTQAGGNVRLSSAPGRGTAVDVYLPVVDEEETAAEGDSPAPARPGERVLVVEDDEVVRTLAERVLQRAGYQVIAVPDGQDALRVLEIEGASLHLVVTDVVMPHLGGRALGRIVAERFPALPVLYTSGYTGGDVVGREVLESETRFLPKPFTPDELIRRVRIALDTKPTGAGT